MIESRTLSVGDLVESKRSGRKGIIYRFNSIGDVVVLQNIFPFVYETFEPDGLKILEKHYLKFGIGEIKNETNVY